MKDLLRFNPAPFPEFDQESASTPIDDGIDGWQGEFSGLDAELTDAWAEVAGELPDADSSSGEFARRRPVRGGPATRRAGAKGQRPPPRPAARAPRQPANRRPLPTPGARPRPLPVRPSPRLPVLAWAPPSISVRPILPVLPIMPIPPATRPPNEPPAQAAAGGDAGAGAPPPAPEASASEHVRWVQDCLNRALGLALPVDGVLAAPTRSAVRTFQERQGLAVTGLIGPDTEAALRGACAPGAANAPDRAARPIESELSHAVACPCPRCTGTREATFDLNFKPESCGSRDFEAPTSIAARAAPAPSRLDGFDFDNSTLKPAHRRDIERIARSIAASWQTPEPIRTVRVVGHTDPEGRPQHNQALGLRRALAVRAALQAALRNNRSDLPYKVLILASSKGESALLDTSNRPAGQARNRRVEVFLSTRALQPLPPKPHTEPVAPPPQTQPPGPQPQGVPPPGCDRAALSRRVDLCVDDAKRCLVAAYAQLARALARCRANPLCNAAATAANLTALRRCRAALLACDRAAKQQTGCH